MFAVGGGSAAYALWQWRASSQGETPSPSGASQATAGGTAQSGAEPQPAVDQPAPAPAEEALHTPPHEPPAAVPDPSLDDPLVGEEVTRAGTQAAAIGDELETHVAEQPGFPEDPAMRPVVEGSGDAEEAFEQADTDLGGHREKGA